MKKNMMKMYAALMLAAVCLALTACNGALPESSLVLDASVPDVSSAEPSAAEQIGTQPAAEKPEDDGFFMKKLHLPEAMDTVSLGAAVKGFDCNAVVQDLAGERFCVVGLYRNNVVIQKSIKGEKSDDVVQEYYKYDLKSNILTKLDGNVPNVCFSSIVYALTDDKLEGVCESSSGVRTFYTVDLKNNCVAVDRTEQADTDSESFYFNYAWDEESYMQLWYRLGPETVRYANLSKCGKDGEKKILTHKKAISYAFDNRRIYELNDDAETNMKCVNVLYEDGSLESTILLPEVDKAYREIEKEYACITVFEVIGDRLIVNVRDDYLCTETCFLYDLALKTVTMIPECRVLSPMQSTHSDSLYFYSVAQSLENPVSLYRMDAAGKLTRIADDLNTYCSYATDGHQIVYFYNSRLYLAGAD